MQRSERFTPKILKELSGSRFTYLRETVGTFLGFSIDFFPVYFIFGLLFLIVLNTNPLVVLILSLGCFFYSFFHFYKIFIDVENLVLKKVKIKIPNLKKDFKFIFISDMHYGPEYYGATKTKIKAIVDLINSTNTDLVIYGGDFVCSEIPEDIGQIFDGVKAKTQIGVYGNHDSLYLEKHQRDQLPLEFLTAMKDSKIKFLNNAGFKYNDIFFGGITDIYSLNLDIDKAFEKYDGKSTKVLLSHSPDILDFLKPDDNISLILSGHTHGGQINFPIIGPILPIPCRDKSLVRGLYQKEYTQLFISQGAGFSKTRMRLGTVCEVCEITLIP